MGINFFSTFFTQSDGTIACGAQRYPDWFLRKLEISHCRARKAVGWGTNRVIDARWGHVGTGLLVFYVKHDINIHTMSNIKNLLRFCKNCNRLLLRNTFCKNLKTLKIKISPFTPNCYTIPMPQVPTPIVPYEVMTILIKT